jgi:glycerol kinase
MVVNDWLCQFLADILDCPVQRPTFTETTARGAAMLAALGAGLVSDLQGAAAAWELDREFLPTMDADRRSRLLTGWREAVKRAQ